MWLRYYKPSVGPRRERNMALTHSKSLEEYLALEYTFTVEADPDRGYVVSFPDLPGCLTQVDDLHEIPTSVEEVRTLWLTTAYEQGIAIPLPTYPDEAGGKILLRLPKSLHRRLLRQAEREAVSLNQYAVSVRARGDAQAAIEGRLTGIEQQLREFRGSAGGAADRHSVQETAPIS
jgi:antitoxin HicB